LFYDRTHCDDLLFFTPDPKSLGELGEELHDVVFVILDDAGQATGWNKLFFTRIH
jgi:hypothetical protein